MNFKLKNMDNIEKFNLSENLKYSFTVAFELAKGLELEEITIDDVLSNMLINHLSAFGSVVPYDELLLKYFENFENDDKEDIKNSISHEMDNQIKERKSKNVKGVIITNLLKKRRLIGNGKESIVLSDSLSFLLEKLETIYNHNAITSFNFLALSELEDKESNIVPILRKYGITYEALSKYQLSSLLGSVESSDILGIQQTPSESKGNLKEKRITNNDNSPHQQDNDEDKEFELAGAGNEEQFSNSDPNSKTPYLDKYSYNMTKAAKEGRYDPVIGRELEISQIIEVLSCRKKKNVILLGDAGAGKSTCIEGLAQMIIDNKVPMELRGKEIRCIDLTSMVSGSIYRGEYEAKILGIIHEMEDNPNIIGFIDEIHNLVGSGSSSQNNDGANILKPYLSRGSITLIGSTTEEEYRKFIEKDTALKRRFQTVTINEPSLEETVKILEGISPKYEQFHRVKYSPEVIKACVEWSARYINDRYFPDKAIDCLDISGALTKLEKVVDMSSIENLESSLNDIIKEKIDLIDECNFEEAQRRRDTEILLRKELEDEKKKFNDSQEDRDTWPEVSIDNVAAVVSKISRVPMDKIRQTTFDKLVSMKKAMEKRIIGQDEAIKKVFMNLSRQFMGIKDANKPASLLFVGRTGTGKTELVKVIADEVFSGEKSLIRINGGDFIEKGSVTKLIGASASYVGYDDEPLLLQIKRRPFSVFLIDEVEKMSEEILNTIFLPILDEGYTTLANNEKISFKNTIIVMTSNLGVREVSNKHNLGFSKVTKEIDDKENEDIILKAIKKKFRPEMLNRISGGVVFFASLGEKELLEIFNLEFKKLQDRLSEKGFNISVTKELKEFVVSKCDIQYGARDLQREMAKWIEETFIDALMNNPNNPEKNIIIDLENDKPKVVFGTFVNSVVTEKKEA